MLISKNKTTNKPKQIKFQYQRIYIFTNQCYEKYGAFINQSYLDRFDLKRVTNVTNKHQLTSA